MTELGGQARPAWNFPSVGRWGVSVLPSGWIFVSEFGIRQITMDAREIAANVALGQDTLPHENGLVEYIAAQAKLIEGHFEGAKVAGPQASNFADAEEVYLFMIRHKPEGVSEMLHVQTYVRTGLWLGVVTFTTVEAQLRNVRPSYEAFLKGLRILPPRQ